MEDDDVHKTLQKLFQQGEKRLLKSDLNLQDEKDKVEKNLFFTSIASGNHKSIHTFLLKGIDPNTVNDEGRSGLHIAALGSHQDVFSTLLHRGADPEKSDKNGITPLMCAAQVGSQVIVSQLLDKGVDVAKKTNDGLSAVFYALFNGYTKIAKQLEDRQSCIHQLSEEPTAGILEKAVKKNWLKVIRFMNEKKCDVSYRIKLMLACQAGLCGHTEMLQYFQVKYDDKVDEDGRSPLRCAVQNGFFNAVEYMLNNGCDVTNNEECVKIAILTGHLDILKLLRAKGAPIFEKDEQNVTPVQLAIAQCSYDLFRYLVEQGCSLEPHEKMGSLPLMAVSVRQTEILEFLKFLAEKNVNLDEQDPETGETTLLAISQKGPIEAVEFLADKECNLNAQNRRDVTPALRAAHNKQEDILMLLGERGAKLDIPNRNGETAIICAARNKSLSMVRYLADKKCRLDSKDVNGHTLAFYAVKDNNVALMNFLQQRKVCLDEPDSNGMTPLIIAVRKGAMDAIKLLTSRPNLCLIDHKDRAGKTALHHAVSIGTLEVIKYLHEKGADLNTSDHDGNTLLLEALKKKRSFAVLEFLTSLPCDIQATNRELKTAMHYACMEKENDALMHLLESKLPRDSQDCKGLTPFMISSAQGSESLVTVLKSVGADVNRRNHNGENAVHLAVKSGNLKIVQCFSLFGCDMDQEDNNGITPLMIACAKNKLDMARFLANKKVDVNAVARNGRTPAHFACESGSLDLLRLLHSRKAKLDEQDLMGVTPIFLAAANQNKEYLEFLCNADCELKATDRSLKSVLHYAVEGKNAHPEVFQFLIDNGLDPNALDESGVSPQMLSVQIGNQSILTTLRDKGGRIDETVDQEWRSITHLACETGNLQLLRDIEGQVSFSSRTKSKESCLTIASANGHEEVINFLLQKRVHVNHKNALGDNCLLAAVKNGHLKIVPLLLKAGARVQDTNDEGSSALHIICSKPCSSKMDKVKMLKMETNEHLEDLKRSIEKFQSPDASIKPKLLDIASKTKDLPDRLLQKRLPPGCLPKSGAIKCLKRLLDAGADINAVDNSGKGALHCAAAVGSKNVIQFLLSKNAQVNLPDKNKETPIFHAIRHGKEKATEALLDHGADANATNAQGLSIYSLAVALNCSKSIGLLRQKGAQLSIEHVVGQLKLKEVFKHQNLKHLEFLLDNGFDGKKMERNRTILQIVVESGDIQLLKSLRTHPKCTFLKDIVDNQDADGNTALHWALIAGRLDMAEVLLDLQCRTDLRNSRGHTLLQVAVMENKLNLVKWVFDQAKIAVQPDAAEPESTRSPLHLSACLGNLSVFKYLESKGYKADATCSNKNNCAHYAAIHGNLQILEYITETNRACLQSKNAQQMTPFHCAVLNGHEEAANFLHQNDDDNAMPDYIVHLAVQRGHQHMTDWLVKRGAPLSTVNEATGEGTLRFAVASGNLHLIQKVISGMADWKDSCNNHGNSLAQSAALFGHNHVLRFLKENNVPLEIADLDGDTPVLECANSGHLESIKLLLEYKCNIQHKNEMSRGIVHLACLGSGNNKGHLDIVKFASDQQLPLDEADNQGNTGLMYACRQGFKEIAEFLLSDNRCDPNKANLLGVTAAHLTVKAGRSDILELLDRHGARLDAEDANGTTPLMIGVANSNLECVTLLLDKVGLGDGDSRNQLQLLSVRASAEVRREMERRGLQLPAPAAGDGSEANAGNDLIFQDINMEMCLHHRQNATVQEGQNVGVEDQQINDNDSSRSTYFGGIRCCKPFPAQDLTRNNALSSVPDEDTDVEDADEDDEDASAALEPAVQQLQGLQLPREGELPQLPNCAQQ